MWRVGCSYDRASDLLYYFLPDSVTFSHSAEGYFDLNFLLESHVADEAVQEYKVIREIVGLVTSLQPRGSASALPFP